MTNTALASAPADSSSLLARAAADAGAGVPAVARAVLRLENIGKQFGAFHALTDVSLELVEWANYLDQIYFGQTYDATPMSNSGGTNTPDPNDFTTLLLSSEDVPGSGNNLASYVNPEVDDLIEQARTLPGCDQAARAEIYYKIQQIAHDDVAYDWTYVPNIFQVANKRVGNFNPGPAWVFYGYTAYIHEWTLAE